MADFFIKRPVFAIVLSLLITLSGLVAMRALPIEQYPQIVPPQVQVTATYPGASAEVIADTVASPLEQSINGVDDMIYMSSTSSGSGAASITVTFKIGTDADQATINVNNRVQAALAKLPAEVRQYGVSVDKQSSAFLQVIALSSPDNSMDQVAISNYALVNVIDELRRIPGVGSVLNFVAKDYSMRVWLNPDKLAQLKLTPTDVENAISEQNAQFSAGKVGAEPMDKATEFTYTISTQGRLETVEQFENIILRSDSDGSVLRLKDVARVELGSQNYDVTATLNGQATVPIGIFLAPGANQLDTGKAVEATMKRLEAKFPAGLKQTIPYDTTRFVSQSIDEVVHTFVEAMILVFAVVFLFLQNWRATLIPCLAVPVSIIGTFAGMYLLGFSINTLTLFGMVLAIGIVVDDAIVVLENVERIMQETKMSVVDSTRLAMQEVSGPVVAIVLVLCAVFVPVAFLGGIAGEMYKQFAITIAVSVTISGLVALTLTPALCIMMLKPTHHEPNRFFKWFNQFFDRLTKRYSNGVAFFIKRALVGGLVFLGLIVVTLGLFRIVPSSLAPDEDQGYILGVGILPDGASLQRTQVVGKQIESIANTFTAKQDVFVINGFDLFSGSNKTNSTTFFMPMKDWSERTSQEDAAQSIVGTFTGMAMGMVTDGFVIAANPPPISGMSNTGGFEGYVQTRNGSTSAELAAKANELVAAARQRPELMQVRSDYSTSVPQIDVQLDREKARTLGVPVNSVFAAMQATFGALYVNDFNYLGRSFRVQLQSEANFRDDVSKLNSVFVRSNAGDMIPLSALLHVKQTTGPEIQTRFNALSAAKVSGSPAPGYSSGQAIKAMEEASKQVLGGDYTLAWSGSAFQEQSASGSSVQVYGFALIIVFLILAALYNKWTLPVVVLLAVPFAIFGAILANWLRGLANDVYFQVALITLIGLAAKNAILIVEFALMKREEGLSYTEAAVQAAKLRFRPIVMTSLAFMLGCVPLAISTGAGAASRHSIGTGVIGGMLAATFLATFVIPMFYIVVMQMTDNVKARFNKNKMDNEVHHA
ncbi:efflux RND transporter permease subunit [Hydromonas duriensis]|uniref:Efflux pump membrane transporter n=1 Tax=Hydromonas duriensis TaxID=1527608 RepID=A0A4R6Y8D7_9BURK|nr:multidrug efflux RND transporter permease subunit [Hydromonas duriensis]TDR31669.1 HAE1 family hydrophobic/amphiphilic exporter-1/multidrug efflux pump [Hydromonas duriensis]